MIDINRSRCNQLTLPTGGENQLGGPNIAARPGRLGTWSKARKKKIMWDDQPWSLTNDHQPSTSNPKPGLLTVRWPIRRGLFVDHEAKKWTWPWKKTCQRWAQLWNSPMMNHKCILPTLRWRCLHHISWSRKDGNSPSTKSWSSLSP